MVKISLRAEERELRGLKLKPLMYALKKIAGFTTQTAEETKNLLKSVDSGVSVADSVIKDLPVKKTKGYLTINDEPNGKLNKILARGDLKELLSFAKKDITITTNETKAYEKIIGKTSEKSVKDVETLSNINKKINHI